MVYDVDCVAPVWQFPFRPSPPCSASFFLVEEYRCCLVGWGTTRMIGECSAVHPLLDYFILSACFAPVFCYIPVCCVISVVLLLQCLALLGSPRARVLSRVFEACLVARRTIELAVESEEQHASKSVLCRQVSMCSCLHLGSLPPPAECTHGT